MACESLHKRLHGEGDHVVLVILAEESETVWLVLLLVDELVEAVEVWLGCTVQVVPPVTHKILLAEDCPVRAEEPCGLPTGCAHVEGLK